MPQPVYTVLFDLDGTLLDTLGDLADAINFAMRNTGHPEKADAEVLAAIGNGIRNAIRSSLPGQPSLTEVDAALSLFKEQYKKCYLNKTQPYPGVVEIMHALRAKGYKIGVISNKSDEFTAGLVSKFFSGLVDASAGERQGVPLKPAPEAVFSLISQIGGDLSHTIYVGDSEVDAATAMNAGAPCVLVSWGFRGRGTLLQAKADAEASGMPYPIRIADNAAEALEAILEIANGHEIG